MFAYIAAACLCIMLYVLTEIYTNEQKNEYLNSIHLQLCQMDPRLIYVDVFEGGKSYTENKQKICICMRDHNGNYYDANMLVYVLCHEYAHVVTNDGHGAQFIDAFSQYLKQAEAMGMYNPSVAPVEQYCQTRTNMYVCIGLFVMIVLLTSV